MQILVATNNPSKLARVRQLLAGPPVECQSPADLGIPAVEVAEGSYLDRNAEMKARAYQGKTDLPILGMDSAFVIPGEDLDPAKVKRNALGGRDESDMTSDEVKQAMVAFYREIALRRGGRVEAFWKDAFALIQPDGTLRREHSERPVVLTPETKGEVNAHFPLRSMYLVGPTGKYTADQTPADEILELKPYQDALKRLLGIA